MLRLHQICDRQKFCTLLLATLMALTVWARPTSLVFADLSPEFSGSTASLEASPPIQLAEANLGSVDDYMHQDGDGPSTSAVPPQGYSSQPIPPQNYYPQGAPPPEWNNRIRRPEHRTLGADRCRCRRCARRWIVGVAAAPATTESKPGICSSTQTPSPACRRITKQHRSAGLSTDQTDALARDQNTASDARLLRPVATTPLESDYFLTSRRRCK